MLKLNTAADQTIRRLSYGSSTKLLTRYNSILQTLKNHILKYPTPLNLSNLWAIGSQVGLFFALQIITGVILAMHYTAHTDHAFDSVVHIMRDVKYGWFFRYAHANGATFIFILLYIHTARGLYYQSYLTKPGVWVSGLVMFLLMMATAFIGYVLPWGQMSFWGATVITSLVTAIPGVGTDIAYWLWGGFSISNATLNRFFSLHYLLPFLILGLIFLHLVLLHDVGSSDPEVTPDNPDKLPFVPYYFYKDTMVFLFILMLFVCVVCFCPNKFGHPDNFIPANPLVTPAHIVPEWYFTPFYAILRSCPNKIGGVISMLFAILILFLLPLYRYLGVNVNIATLPYSLPSRISFFFFLVIFLGLMYLGSQPAEAPFVFLGQMFSTFYFVYFLIALPVAIRYEKIIIFKERTLQEWLEIAKPTWFITKRTTFDQYIKKLLKLYNQKLIEFWKFFVDILKEILANIWDLLKQSIKYFARLLFTKIKLLVIAIFKYINSLR